MVANVDLDSEATMAGSAQSALVMCSEFAVLGKAFVLSRNASPCYGSPCKYLVVERVVALGVHEPLMLGHPKP